MAFADRAGGGHEAQVLTQGNGRTPRGLHAGRGSLRARPAAECVPFVRGTPLHPGLQSASRRVARRAERQRGSHDRSARPAPRPPFKGFPHGSPPLRALARSAAQGWNVHGGRPAVAAGAAARARRSAQHRLDAALRAGRAASASRRTARRRCRRSCCGASSMPGAWGLTFANVTQLQAGLRAGARNLPARQPGARCRRSRRDRGAARRRPGHARRVPARLARPARAHRDDAPRRARSRCCSRSASPAAAPAAHARRGDRARAPRGRERRP